MKSDATPIHILLYEGSDASAIAPAHRFAIISTLLDRGYTVTRAQSVDSISAPTDRLLIILGDFPGKQIEAPASEPK